MKIDAILSRMTAEECEVLWDNATAEPYNAWELTVGDFCRMVDSEDGVFKFCKKNIKADTVAEWFAKAKGVVEGINAVIAEINKLDMPTTAEEQQATRGVEFLTFSQAVICDTVVFFGLTATEQAEQVAVADWFIFAKKRFAETLYKRNYEKIIQKKYAKGKSRL